MYKKILLASVSLFIISACSSTDQNIPLKRVVLSTSNLTNSYRTKMLAYINNMRTKGATCSGPTTPLHWNENLEATASAHAKDMALNNFVEHIGSGKESDPAKIAPGIGSTFVDRIKYFGYPLYAGALIGENITRLSIKTTGSSDLMANFKRGMKVIYKDQAHCKILMDPRFTDVGAGLYRSNGSYYFAIEFGGRK